MSFTQDSHFLMLWPSTASQRAPHMRMTGSLTACVHVESSSGRSHSKIPCRKYKVRIVEMNRIIAEGPAVAKDVHAVTDAEFEKDVSRRETILRHD